MQQYHVTYTYDRANEVVAAERETVEAKNCVVVLRHTVIGMGQPREVVVRRIAGAVVRAVNEVEVS